ncbi:DNA-binding protein [Celeribacter ethanolicus]|uniref:DNA-binding protein n=1 Tax=Celeribacter ethanolicus TaxID=1758178 RepID=A0A291GBS2_9RHOB|nr:helix-turn-helix domain-containing protein [Celeribacter ethanolicus]ATG47641.1 DNA-binding protein [Celeribacter ethanolicus]
MQDDDVLTVKELAAFLKIAEKTAYRFASEGKVPGFKVGSAWRFRKSEIDRWIAEQEKRQEGQEK